MSACDITLDIQRLAVGGGAVRFAGIVRSGELELRTGSTYETPASALAAAGALALAQLQEVES